MNIRTYILLARLILCLLSIIIFIILFSVIKAQKVTIKELQATISQIEKEKQSLQVVLENAQKVEKQYLDNLAIIEKQGETIKNESKKVLDSNTDWRDCALPTELRELFAKTYCY